MKHEDLIGWQKSMDLAVSVYEFTSALPDTEKYGLISQMRRCSCSIPSNIAEGKGRFGSTEFKRFLGIAAGSLAELKTQVLLCERIYKLEVKEMTARTEEVSRLLYGLISKLVESSGS